MNHAWQLAELERRLHNLLRLGVVADLDAPRARVKVSVGSMQTDWIPWLADRAGTTRSWSAPVPGEQVLLLSPAGDLGRAVALPALYQDSFPPPARAVDVAQVRFPDGSLVSFDAANHVLDVSVAAGGRVNVRAARVTIEASEEVRLATPRATCTGDLMVHGRLGYGAGLEGKGGAVMRDGASIEGSMRNNGIDIGSGHRHAGVRGGTDVSGTPV